MQVARDAACRGFQNALLVQLIFNTTEGWQSLLDSKSIREAALEKKLPYYTTAAACLAVAQAIAEVSPDQLEVRSLQDYYS